MYRLTNLFAAGALALSAGAAQAASIDPLFDSFGEFNTATFGGSGIPTDEVAIATVGIGAGETLTVALTATRRSADGFTGPDVPSDGAGTFQAIASPFPTDDDLALWNFGFYAATSAGTALSTLSLEILFDFDPSADTDQSALGTIALSSILSVDSPLTPTVDETTLPIAESSQNLGFDFLTGSPGVTGPAGFFDPNVHGEYTFAIANGGTILAAINVNTVPLPAGAWLLLGGLGGLAMLRRRQKATA